MEKWESTFTKNFDMHLMPKLKLRIVVSCIFLSLLIFLFVYYKNGVILDRPMKEAPNEYLVGILSIIITALLTILLITDVFVAFFCAIFSIIPTRKSKNTGSIKNIVQMPSGAFIRQGNKQKELILSIDESLKNVFIYNFIQSNTNTNHNSYEILKEQLMSRSWVAKDLGRIALLVFSSKILKDEYQREFRKWMIEFFKLIGQAENCPAEPDKSTYQDFSKSRNIEMKKVFSDLMNWYNKANDKYIKW